MEQLSTYLHVQSIAKSTISELKDVIKEGISEREIVCITEEILRAKGVKSFWYHGIGAFVHVGKRTTISESGKGYKPTDTLVGRNDIVTVDLSPEMNSYWGDYARTFIIIDGKAVGVDALACSDNDLELRDGVKVGENLHNLFMDFIKPDMTFEEVYLHMNEAINQLGYINLDFAGNLGHTIEFDKDNRRYLESGNKTKLSEVTLFTFEPHIKPRNLEYGFKREDIYYFRDGELLVL
ncbi:aminopeptidase P family protein [Paenibacillus rhizovicinus]|uniref:Aminopeptidase P family protein n=1 Tax=Paenibacillus rhizovicinus TaxID=2704463 RepID=A0A6C0PB74_9BACL|nr:M24 family metallopeptidase [Paenibacillus rhizovicinus]QHW33822.1 aminopeptidase P family protein [Paenibacillus rhizovicinus]